MAGFLPYAHCYCEENTYVCLEKIHELPDLFDRSYAVFMSSFRCRPQLEKLNHWESTVPYRSFKNAVASEDFVVWDYHVITIVRFQTNGKWYVIDHDSGLPRTNDSGLGKWEEYCIDFNLYYMKTILLENSFAGSSQERIKVLMEAVRYRVIISDAYLCFFRSNRSHMIDDTGKYSQKPPTWPPIQRFPLWADAGEREKVKKVLSNLQSTFSDNNLTCFINMANSTVPGTVLNRKTLLTYFS